MSDYQDEELQDNLPDLPDESVAELADEEQSGEPISDNIDLPAPPPAPGRVTRTIDTVSQGTGKAADSLLARINRGLMAPKGNSRDEMKDLFEVPQPEDNDIYSDDLLELDAEDVMGGDEDMSDLFTVTREDIMGRPITSRRNRRMRRTGKNTLPRPS